MIQDIGSLQFNNRFDDRKPGKQDEILVFNSRGEILVSFRDDRIRFPKVDMIDGADEMIWLFSVDDDPYYLALTDGEQDLNGFSYQPLRNLFGDYKNVDLLISFTAYHLWRWYTDNRLCGRCGHRLEQKKDERALICPECGNVIYPRINPAVIVGVIRGNSLLITRYKSGYQHNALVAGFTEIGETLEQTVAREVMEETGVRVKNIRYYKSQPWGIAQDVLMGFFCEADGDCEIRMDTDELKYAEWVPREEIMLQPNNLSLTNEMMKVFRDGFV